LLKNYVLFYHEKMIINFVRSDLPLLIYLELSGNIILPLNSKYIKILDKKKARIKSIENVTNERRSAEKENKREKRIGKLVH